MWSGLGECNTPAYRPSHLFFEVGRGGCLCSFSHETVFLGHGLDLVQIKIMTLGWCWVMVDWSNNNNYSINTIFFFAVIPLSNMSPWPCKTRRQSRPLKVQVLSVFWEVSSRGFRVLRGAWVLETLRGKPSTTFRVQGFRTFWIRNLGALWGTCYHL
jgi:hypothetical protein